MQRRAPRSSRIPTGQLAGKTFGAPGQTHSGAPAAFAVPEIGAPFTIFGAESTHLGHAPPDRSESKPIPEPPLLWHCLSVNPSLTDTLCTQCGLCCDGSLFADVELAAFDDSAALEVLGLELEDDDNRPGGELLLQPCAALRGRRCGIYSHRPKCCQTFECRLLRDVRLGKLELSGALIQVAQALAEIDRVQKLIAQLGSVPENLPLKERCAEILEITEDSTDPATFKARDELEAAMTVLEKQLLTHFLDVQL